MKVFIPIGCALLLLSCTKNDAVTYTADYEEYLTIHTEQHIERLATELDFWNTKIQSDSIQLIAMGKAAGLYTQLFDQTGKVSYLKQAETLWKNSADVAAIHKDSYQQALARNYVTQHRFKEALRVLEHTDEGFATSLQLFDVHLELGNDEKAKSYLDTWKDKKSFDVLIRLSKWNDHRGDLDTAIAYLESATKLVEQRNDPTLLTWAYSNLADYYGHAGRIQDSYDHYLKTLQIDPSYSYALKGIAWIIFSHEQNAEEATRIVEHIAKRKNTPDLQLFLAELAHYQGSQAKQWQHTLAYTHQVNDSDYGVMYDAYSIELLAEDEQTTHRALRLALQEVQHRPTAEIYSLLALAQLKDDRPKAALSTIETHVNGQSFEPMVQYRMAQVYKANGQTKMVNTLKEELLEASYELGPVLTQEINAL